ncbi:DUF4395 domain-containing protein [Rarobacter faecitabidus]|uniref:Uncharacterized protein DUF4395 n=1 Tax=Rarobacter faecitabidus TaxID=13243 RepID=A0A542ZUU1_RARFA|nr:DUF4395 domain-containing protein [Rarobacter faecitabidus]TQL64128.1 uncharacterized protein DUF4395 [Rarobacter faecitabidus]
MSTETTTKSRPKAIDSRAPRFAAAITATLLVVAVFLAAIGNSPTAGEAGTGALATDPGFILLAVIAVLFAWSYTSPATAPWGVLFRKAVQPRISAPTQFEDPRPPRFSQLVGLIVVAAGLVLHLVAVPWALVIFGAAAFVAAFLNAAFGFCLGCKLYLILVRVRVIRPATPLV